MNKYKVGDKVILVSERPNNWIREMDEFLGKVVTLTEIRENRIMFDGTKGWTFLLEEIAGYADEETIRKLEKERIKRERAVAKRLKKCMYNPEDVLKLAIDVFGEERVDFRKGTESIYSIVVRFPEINVENNSGEKHIIKDLLFKIDININIDGIIKNSGYKANVDISGCRLLMSLKEYESNYRWSHLKTGKSGWGRFCLGHSDFGIIIQNVQTELTEEAWVGFFLGIEPYLRWESVEGGPYIRLNSIKYNASVSGDRLQTELANIIKNIPKNCWEFVNSPRINTYHPDVFDYVRKASSIKKLSSYSPEEIRQKIEEENKFHKTKSAVKWKDEDVYFQIIKEDDKEEYEFKTEVLEEYSKIINREGQNFSKKYQYAKRKRQYQDKVFGAI